MLAVPLVNCVDKKKPRDEIIGNSSHRMAIFSLSVVISFLLFCLLLKIENSLWRASYYNCLFKFPIEFNQIIEIIALTRVRTGVIFITCLSSFTFKKIYYLKAKWFLSLILHTSIRHITVERFLTFPVDFLLRSTHCSRAFSPPFAAMKNKLYPQKVTNVDIKFEDF